MVKIKEVPLNIVFPNDGIGMVVMQPFIKLCNHEPFCWIDSDESCQIERIIRTLYIAKQADHNCDKTHFTIFPEYSIPGIVGIEKIQEILENGSWENGTIVIGGVDGLTKEEYSNLCCTDNTEVCQENAVDNVRDDQWINCCITWVKNEDGVLKRWVQPKLCPSWPEENIIVNDMLEGKTVYIFEGRLVDKRAFRFMSVLCFDWISALGSLRGIFSILEKINRLVDAEPYGKPLHLCFVLQYNEKPNHPSFLNNVYEFFSSPKYPFVLRDAAVVAMLNTAGNYKPGPTEKYGYSCFVFSPNSSYDQTSCPPTYALRTEIIRENEILRTCKEALFRENGACIHSFRLFHPLFVNVAPEDRRRPISPALVHSWKDSLPSDARTPGAQVPAIIKWVNDKIDKLDTLSAHAGVGSSLRASQKQVSDEISHCNASFLQKAMKLATVEMTDGENVDNWQTTERESLETLIYGLSIISSSKSIQIKDSPAHASLIHDHDVIDLIVVNGETHKNTLHHIIKNYSGKKERKTMIISRDKLDTPLTDKDKPIYEAESDVKRVGFFNLKGCLDANDENELNEKITRILGV